MSKQLLKNGKTISELRIDFWNAPNEALLDRETTAAGVVRSLGWMELKAITGGGIPFLKCGRRCLYRKSDSLAWLEANSKRVNSTSEYDTAVAQGVQGE
jgi:hypothetical protein